eukprot:PDM65225.1 hypothetical protein PRIPAC_52167 [Pristionchus pacificus]
MSSRWHSGTTGSLHRPARSHVVEKCTPRPVTNSNPFGQDTTRRLPEFVALFLTCLGGLALCVNPSPSCRGEPFEEPSKICKGNSLRTSLVAQAESSADVDCSRRTEDDVDPTGGGYEVLETRGYCLFQAGLVPLPESDQKGSGGSFTVVYVDSRRAHVECQQLSGGRRNCPCALDSSWGEGGMSRGGEDLAEGLSTFQLALNPCACTDRSLRNCTVRTFPYLVNLRSCCLFPDRVARRSDELDDEEEGRPSETVTTSADGSVSKLSNAQF